jgi:hypothetical protein
VETLARQIRLLLILLDVIIIFLFCMAFLATPEGFSSPLASLCIFTFFAYFAYFIAFRYRIISNVPIVLSAEISFSAFYYILFFHPYVKHLLDIEDYSISKFFPYTFPNGANQALVLAVIGYIGYHLGVILPRPAKIPEGAPRFAEERGAYRLFDILFASLFWLVCLFYIASGLQSADTSRYTDPNASSVVADGLYLVIILFCVIAGARAIATLLQGSLPSLWQWASLGLTLLWTLHVLVSGDRNNFLIIALSLSGGAAAFLFRVRWTLVIAGLVAALLLYKGIEVVRMMPEPTLDAFVEAIEAGGDDEPGASSFGNTTATLRATFSITPDQVPYGYGLYKVVGFAGIVPLIRGYFLNYILDVGQTYIATAAPLSDNILGFHATWGLGSNILSDIYMDFGLVGVPILMALVGWVQAALRRRIIIRGLTTKVIFLYMIMFSTFAEMPRYSFDFPVRTVVWGWLLLAVYEHVFFRKRTPGAAVAARSVGGRLGTRRMPGPTPASRPSGVPTTSEDRG